MLRVRIGAQGRFLFFFVYYYTKGYVCVFTACLFDIHPDGFKCAMNVISERDLGVFRFVYDETIARDLLDIGKFVLRIHRKQEIERATVVVTYQINLVFIFHIS